MCRTNLEDSKLSKKPDNKQPWHRSELEQANKHHLPVKSPHFGCLYAGSRCFGNFLFCWLFCSQNFRGNRAAKQIHRLYDIRRTIIHYGNGNCTTIHPSARNMPSNLPRQCCIAGCKVGHPRSPSLMHQVHASCGTAAWLAQVQ